MHQKQPPAKTAFFVASEREFWLQPESGNRPVEAITKRAKPRIVFMLLMLGQRRWQFVPKTRGLFCLVRSWRDCHKRVFPTNRRFEMLKSAAILFGVVFLAIGILGFVPGITTDDMLLGIFHVNPAHSVVHILSGVIALLCGM